MMEEDRLHDHREAAAMWSLAIAERQMSIDEQREFDTWVADAENARALEEATRLWALTGRAAELPEVVRLRQEALESFGASNRRRWTDRIGGRHRWIGGLAAAILLLAFASLVAMRSLPQVYETGTDERRVVVLADGSKLSLDADTEVDVRLRRERRELTLVRGRARFNVAKDSLRPFAVTVGDKVVVATGTSFSVELLEGKVHVLLYEGHVAVLERGGGEARPLQAIRARRVMAAERALAPGNELIAERQGDGLAFVRPAPLAPAMSWEAGQLNFDEEPLSSAIERMNRYSHRQLVVSGSGIGDIRINGVFTAGDTNSFVDGLLALHPLRARQEGDRILIEKK